MQLRRRFKPWLEQARAARGSPPTPHAERKPDARSFLVEVLASALGELIVAGIEGCTASSLRAFRERAGEASSLGFAHLPAQLEALADAPSAARVLALAVFISFTLEVTS